jgi:Fur family transcriptional regulator, zinc uptake regulator
MSAPIDLTRNEALVLDALRHEGAPRSAYQLLETLRGEGLRAPPQIYRALKTLGERGLVHKLESRNAYLACSHDHHHGHDARPVVFLVCDRCEGVEEVPGTDLEPAFDALAHAYAFKRESASAEIRGRCRDCLPLTPSAKAS